MALSVRNEHQGTVGDPRKIPRPAGECAGLRDDAHLLGGENASPRSSARDCASTRMRHPEARLATVLHPNASSRSSALFPAERGISRAAYLQAARCLACDGFSRVRLWTTSKFISGHGFSHAASATNNLSFRPEQDHSLPE